MWVDMNNLLDLLGGWNEWMQEEFTTQELPVSSPYCTYMYIACALSSEYRNGLDWVRLNWEAGIMSAWMGACRLVERCRYCTVMLLQSRQVDR